jgi:2-C-methyl-D-erythritol 4-phosphate cytidylyltransferase
MWPFGRRKKEAETTPYCAAVIVAAGSAARMQGIDKIMTPLGLEPVIVHAVRPFQRSPLVQEIVVVTREDLIVPVGQALKDAGMDKVRLVMVGGADRAESVVIGLDAVSRKTRLVAVHDGARPLVTEEIVNAAISKAAETGAAAPAIPVKDTIKIAKDGVVERTPKRSTLFAVQTPQVFDRDLLRGALQKAREDQVEVTDDCMACERIGMKVHLIPGSEENLKITTPLDLVLADEILAGR